MDEEVEPDAACREQAAESLVSRSSFASLIERAVSYGEKNSQIELKCTVERAGGKRGQTVVSMRPWG